MSIGGYNSGRRAELMGWSGALSALKGLRACVGRDASGCFGDAHGVDFRVGGEGLVEA